MGYSISTDYERRGIETIFLENDHLRVEVLAGKGGDITEIRDKRTDVNVLFEAPHEWRPPGRGLSGRADAEYSFLDHYPGGWQDVLPGAGGPSEGSGGAPFPLHGETPLIPWDYEVREASPDRVAVKLTTSLTRYPFDVTRVLSLNNRESTLRIEETVTNTGRVAVSYSWLQHIALGEPLIGPAATLDVPCEKVLVDPGQTNDTARLPPGAEFEWPICDWDDGRVDLREMPSKEERVHDLVALTELREGWYTVRNPTQNLGVTVEFPEDLYEYLWYWQPFGGFEGAPFFGRNYNVGLEPCTSIPNAGLREAINNETARSLSPGETKSMSIAFRTHPLDG
jgi:galactose mutarotase-like enzyme